MKPIGKITRRGSVLFVVLLLCMPGFTLGAQENEFVPGDDRIIEKDILKRIQQELGQDIAREKPKAVNIEVTAAEKSDASQGDQGTRSVTLALKTGRTVAGSVVLSQESVTLRPEGGVREIRVPMRDIQRIEFLEWKAARVRMLAAREPAAETPDAGEAAPETGGPRVRIYFLPTRCRVVKTDGTTVDGGCNSMNWLHFNMDGGPGSEPLRTYFVEERPLPGGGAEELERSLPELEGEAPVDTVISVELGGFARETGSGTARREE